MSAEKERLLKMLDENKISENDYKILLAAIDSKNSKFKFIISLLVNPFQKIAGVKSLVIGVAIIFVMSYIGVLAKLYYSAILDITNATEVLHPKVPLSFLVLLYQNLVIWILLSAVYIIIAKIFRAKKVRIVDFLGTTALARYPYFFFTILFFITQLFVPNFSLYDTAKGYIHPNILMMLLGVIFLLCGIWQLVAYYYAFKESSGLTHKKLWIGFVVSMLIAEIASLKLAEIFM